MMLLDEPKNSPRRKQRHGDSKCERFNSSAGWLVKVLVDSHTGSWIVIHCCGCGKRAHGVRIILGLVLANQTVRPSKCPEVIESGSNGSYIVSDIFAIFLVVTTGSFLLALCDGSFDRYRHDNAETSCGMAGGGG